MDISDRMNRIEKKFTELTLFVKEEGAIELTLYIKFKDADDVTLNGSLAENPNGQEER